MRSGRASAVSRLTQRITELTPCVSKRLIRLALQRLVNERGADTIAAFVCEPVMGTGGVYPPSLGYLTAVQGICRENEILFVVDEVITGFGRTGAMFASERFGLTPDMLILAKGITSG